jgi:protoporphyrinogen oxidase
MSGRSAVIIGAGPAGLTAAVELLRRSDIRPIVLEASQDVGGISRTLEFKGNRMDIGGHRFFSKSDRVMEWWLAMMPLETTADAGEALLRYQNRERRLALAGAADPRTTDRVMLLRKRVSRILYAGKLFDYPLTLSADTLLKLGLARTARIGASYLAAMLKPIRPEKSLEDFFINRFGRVLYGQFFKEYTEKVWGVPCTEISPEWGAQRIKGLSIRKVLAHALKSLRPRGLGPRQADIGQKGTETSLIERFLYPKLGPGQMWRLAKEEVEQRGGEVRFGQRVVRLQREGERIAAVELRDLASGRKERLTGDWFVSTMPVQDLAAGLEPTPPAEIARIAQGLRYRDFITVGVLVDRLELGGGATGRDLAERVPDNWIYIQEPGVKIGRLQIFNNWSPYMVADPALVWLGLEYFCHEGDELWAADDAQLIDLAGRELEKLGIARRAAIRDATVQRVAKTYPAYFGSYGDFPQLRAYLDGIENLFLVGRNGMHRYNNQDHSMLAAMTVVDNILAGRTDKTNVWDVNTEQEYHEEK